MHREERETFCYCHHHSHFKSRYLKNRKPFQHSDVALRFAPHIDFKLEHVVLDLTLDPKVAKVGGVAEYHFKVFNSKKNTLSLDQEGLDIKKVKVNTKEVDFKCQSKKMVIHLPKTYSRGDQLVVSIDYEVVSPKRGLYFTGPDSEYPKKPYQVWSQCQDEDGHFWFPIPDFPNQKTTLETKVTVPSPYQAISNGLLIKREDKKNISHFHYKINQPLAPYLITLVVGEFDYWKEDASPLPIEYFVAKGKKEDGVRAFGNTPEMIRIFSEKLNIPYPFEKYAQVAVQDFIFGGMENSSTTTQTDVVLHDAKAHLDFSADFLVAHELAHQWFGDLVTCREWSHGWLNEGFATYFERIWIENQTTPGGGFEEAKYYSFLDLKEYLDEDQTHYRRPVVCNQYEEPIDLFDCHLYQKGGLVLNLIRHLLGEEDFWLVLNHYLKQNAHASVETIDLVRAIDQVTGKNFRGYLDQWIYGGGYPDFSVQYKWDAEEKWVDFLIEQKQTEGKSVKIEDGVKTHLFQLPVVVEFCFEDGKKVVKTVELNEAKTRVLFHFDKEPQYFRFDPDFWIPKAIEFQRSAQMAQAQLKNDPDCMGRIFAAKELAKDLTHANLQSLSEALQSDVFWGVKAEIAAALSGVQDARIGSILSDAIKKETHLKAKKHLVLALKNFNCPEALDYLKAEAQSSQSYFVQAAAIEAYVAQQIKSFEKDGNQKTLQEVVRFLLSISDVASFRSVVKKSILMSLAKIPGVHRGEFKEAFLFLLKSLKRGEEIDTRVGALNALIELLKTSQSFVVSEIFTSIEQVAKEDSFVLRNILVHALSAIPDPRAADILSKIELWDYDPRVKRAAREGQSQVVEALTLPESIGELKKEMTKIREENVKLKSEWFELSAKK